MKGLLVVLALAAAPAAAIDCSVPDKVAEFKRSSDVDFKACIDNDGAVITPEIKADSATWNGVPYTFPEADGTSGQVLKTDASGSLTWSDDNVGSGGALLTATQTFTGKNTFEGNISMPNTAQAIGFMKLVSSSAFVASTEEELQLPTVGGAYRIFFRVHHNSAGGLQVYFSTATGTKGVAGYTNESIYQSGTTHVSESISASAGNPIRSGRDIAADTSFIGEAFVTTYANNNLVISTWDFSYRDTGAFYSRASGSVHWNPGVGELQSFFYLPDTGTITGSIWVYQLQ